MTKLSDYSKGKVHILLLQAVRQAGSYEPDEVLSRIEEQLTGDQYDACAAFLKWIVTGERSFGYSLPEVWAEWENTCGR